MPEDNENSINVEIENKELSSEFDNTPFQTEQSSEIYGKKTVAVPNPDPQVGIDTDSELFKDIIEANSKNDLDLNALNDFTQISYSRDKLYQLLDQMAQDSIVSAILRTYAEDATEMNDSGKIMWVESSDANCAKMVQFLLDTMNVDKHIFQWTLNVAKYGDTYLRLYRKSELKDPLFENKDKEPDKFNKFVEENIENKNRSLNEDVIIRAYAHNDHYSHYVEMIPNPAEMFELTRLGKSCGYIKADISTNVLTEESPILSQQLRYGFKKNDVEVFEATEFVHACLDEDISRVPEEVSIFLTDDTNQADISYRVKRGKSILYDAYQSWRLLSLLENAILLNRLTKSQLIRLITVDIGSMPRETSRPLMAGLKQTLEQKMALNVNKYLQEYTNPGSVENNVYWTTKNGLGTINIQNIGGEYDPKSLIDLEYYRDRFFGSMSVPKQYYGFTEDGAGFNGGTSLSIISSRYAKTIKRMQNSIIQALTDAINLMLIDRGLNSYINKFQLKMTPPITQEELDRRENLSNKIGVIRDTADILGDITDPVIKLKLIKALLSPTLTDPEVIDLIQQQIDKFESEESEEVEEEPSKEENTSLDLSINQESEELPSNITDLVGNSESNNEESNNEGSNNEQPTEAENEILPSGEDLGLDLTDNQAF